jgi:hypothetical protein
MRPALILFLACSAQALQQSYAFAAIVVPNDYVRFEARDTNFTVRVGPEIFTHAFAVFEYSGHSVDLFLRSADLQYYRVTDFGEVFNPIDPRVEDGLADGGLGEVGTGDFYLGIWLPKGDSSMFDEIGQWYGWIHLRPVDDMLTMVGNAMSFDSRGIIVGTLDVVPEPTSIGVAIVGLATVSQVRIGRMRRRS